MDAFSWIHIIVLGSIVGAFGQSARLVVGIKKRIDIRDISSNDIESGNIFAFIEPGRLLLTLTLGAISGTIAATMMATNGDIHNISHTALGAIAAAGYSGADFIEGAMLHAKPIFPPIEISNSISSEGK